VAQHWGRRRANLSENEGVRSECKKFGENSRQMAPVSTICDEYCRVGSLLRTEEFLPGTSLLLNAQKEDLIDTFAPKWSSQTHRSLVFLEIYH